MVFFGRLVRLPPSVTRAHWDSFAAGLAEAAQHMAASPHQRIPRGRSPAHYKSLVTDILALWHLAREYGPQISLLDLIGHIRTLDAVSRADQDGISLWTGPALEDAAAWTREERDAFRKTSSADLAEKAINIARAWALDTQEVKALPSLLQDRSVGSLRHLSPDMVLRILDGVSQFEAKPGVLAAIARSFRRALEVLCPELPLPLGSEGLIITMPLALPEMRDWGLEPAAAPRQKPDQKPRPVHRPRGPSARR